MRATAHFHTSWRSMGVLYLLIALSAYAITTPARGAIPLKLNDPAISDAIEDEIRADFLVPLNDVDVITTDGIVTLTGVVGTLLTKERAARIAEGVKGVRAVVNRIKVRLYIARTPEQIETAIDRALLANPATESYEVETNANKDGAVALSGSVQSWAEKDLVERVAKDVAGVTEVKNEIVVNYTGSRSDSEIKQEVEERLKWNVLVEDGLIIVRAEEGDVYLTGTVGSAAEKREARLSAWIAGVGTVDVSDLVVARWARDEDLLRAPDLEISDKDIEAAVADALLYDPRVAREGVGIVAVDGVVILRGSVVSLQAKRAAGQDARNTFGVRAIENRIKVRPVLQADDKAIAKDVRAALSRDAVTESWEIRVSVRNGVVTLTGIVDNYYEKSRADDVASVVRGVTLVRNRLKVVDPTKPFVYDPYHDGWPPRNYDWYDYQPRLSWESDAQIKTRIEAQLWWSPFVDSDDVEVTVDDGIATLTGTVDTRSERRAAEENAFEGGATWVRNELEVKRSKG